MTDITKYSNRSTVKLTTIGRKTGQPRTVTIWFVVVHPGHVHVQHSSRAPAQWYKNLLQNPEVTLDFGDGPIKGRAVPIKDDNEIDAILKMVRSKYMMAWLFRLLGWGKTPQVATIQVVAEQS